MAKKQTPKALKTVAVRVEQTQNPDGSINLRPVEVADEREIGSQQAMTLLGLRDIETIATMIQAGLIEGWKPYTKRGNGRWRIKLQSVLDYKEARLREFLR